MRTLFFLLLFLKVLESPGQNGPVQQVSLDDALDIAIRNNSSLNAGNGMKILTRDVKSAWFKWLYQINKLRKLEEHLKLTGDLDRIAKLRYEEGDIDLLEKSWLMHKQAEIRTEIAVISNEIDITANELQLMLNSPAGIEPISKRLTMYQVSKGTLEAPVLQNRRDSLQFRNLQLGLDNCFIRLQFYESTGLEHARLILEVHQARLYREENDFVEFSAGIAEAFTIEMEYLETLNSYNQTAIELEHYAY